MNKKLKIYSVLLAIVLVGTVISNTFHRENYSSIMREGEVLIQDSLKKEFGKVDRKTTVLHGKTVDGKHDTIITTTSWNVQFKPTFEVTVPVRPNHAATDKFLYSNVDGQSCMVEMQKVKLNDIAEVYSGLSYRRYLDEEGIKCNVVVQRSIQADGKLSDFEELKLRNTIKTFWQTNPVDARTMLK